MKWIAGLLVMAPLMLAPVAQASPCVEGEQRIDQGGEGDLHTCEGGQWHEGPPWYPVGPFWDGHRYHDGDGEGPVVLR